MRARPLPPLVEAGQQDVDDGAHTLQIARERRRAELEQDLGGTGEKCLGAGGRPPVQRVVHYVLDGQAQAFGEGAERRHRVLGEAGGDAGAEAPVGVERLGVHGSTVPGGAHRRKCGALRGSPSGTLGVMATPRPGPLVPSVGWGVVHLFLRSTGEPGGEAILAAIDALTAEEPSQVIPFSVLGSEADLGFMALSPDLDALDRFTKAVLAGPVEPVWSYVSLTELSEYASTEEDERRRLVEAGEPDVEARLAEWRERMHDYAEARLHPRLPHRRVIAFYPMSKTRVPGANWYTLPFEERKRLMAGHGRVGRRYAGRVLQLITGSTGISDWEWGVTLLADDPVAVKEIVYEMRFDEVSAVYGEFGPFWTGLVMDARALLDRVGIPVSAARRSLPPAASARRGRRSS